MFRYKRLFFTLALTVILSGSVAVMAQGRSDQGRNNCPVTTDVILGQAFGSTAGAAGELGENGVTPSGEEIESNGLAMDAEWIMQTLPFNELGDAPVAIVVLDDFTSRDDDDVLSHGWLVYQVIINLLEQLPEPAVEQIRVVAVNIADQAGFSGDLIVPRLRETLDELAADGIDRFVINMSFVFIPCEDRALGFNYNRFVESRRNAPERSLIQEVGGNREYILSLLNDSRVAYIRTDRLDTNVEQRIAPQAEARAQIDRPTLQNVRPTPTPRDPVPGAQVRQLAVLRLFENRQLEQDPLREFLQEAPYFMVPVAAAGNFKQELPFYPARWPEVISVSADEGNDLRFWLNSNNGEITVPGAWHLFSDEVYRAGTSFAAPVLSTLIALDLTHAAPVCDRIGRQPVLAHESYENTLLNQAVADFCSP